MSIAGVKTDLPVWLIKGEIKGEKYRQLLQALFPKCRYFSMVTRNALEITENARKMLVDLAPFLVETRENIYEWPGTKISREYEKILGEDWFRVQGATIRLYRCSRDALEYMQRMTESLYQFELPSYPEDLTVYRDIDDPILVTVSHEDMGVIIAGDREKQEIQLKVPGLELVNEREHLQEYER